MSDLLFKRVLVVDDEPSYRKLVQHSVSRFGYECDTAEDAGTASERLESGAYDLVITDIRMPGTDGLHLLKQVKSLSPQVSFIVMTGHPAGYSYSEIIEAGADDYLSKPFESGELKAKIQRLERERRITELLKASNAARGRESELNAAMAELSKALLSSVPVEQISAMILENARELTSSPCGCVIAADRENGRIPRAAAGEGAASGQVPGAWSIACER